MKTSNINAKTKILFLFLFLIVFLLWGNSMYYGQYIEEHYQSVSIRMKTASVSKKMLDTTTKNEQQTGELKEASAWNRVENIMVQCDELNTKAILQLIEVFGNMEAVYPIDLVYGSIPTPDDYEGCLIDEKTAYTLFHTTDVIGNQLSCVDRRYYIRGIIRSSEPVCLLEVGDEEKSYPNLELIFNDRQNGSILAENFLRLLGIANQYVMIDGSLCADMLKQVCLLPAWLLGFCLIYDLFLVLWRRRTIPIQVIVLLALILLLGFLLSWLIGSRIMLPPQLIPTKWSDFSFWSRKANEIKEWGNSLNYIMPNDKDILFRLFSIRCFAYAITATIGMLALITHERMLFYGIGRAWGFIVVAIIEGAVVTILYLSGSIFSLPRAYLAMPIFYMLVRDAFLWVKSQRKSWLELQ
jgi:hypothetical protein